MMENAEIITENEMQKALAAVFKRAQTDAEFRKLCLECPGRAIFEVSGKRLPEGAALNFADPVKPM